MVKSPAEYQRAYRERKAELAKQAGDPTDHIATRPFSDFVADEYPDCIAHYVAEESLACVGIEAPTFDTDTDDHWSPEWDIPNRGSVGRAERMVGAFLDAATELATAINRYKCQEIERAVSTLENKDLTSPAAKKQALAEMARLTRIRSHLEKKERWTFPRYTVTGDF